LRVGFILFYKWNLGKKISSLEFIKSAHVYKMHFSGQVFKV